jgi:hypothetical protein
MDCLIRHCSCGKHCINTSTATGIDSTGGECIVEFTEICPDGGFHVETGKENKSASMINAGKKMMSK